MEEQKTQETSMNLDKNADLLEYKRAQKKAYDELKAELENLRKHKETPIEARITKLEARISAIEDSLFQEIQTVKGMKKEVRPEFKKRVRNWRERN